MKTKIFLSVLAFGLVVSAFSQKSTMELTFTAEYNGQHIPLDSILIENLTQGGDTTLYAPDTVLILDYLGIVDNKYLLNNSFSISQNYPNPFSGRTKINLFLSVRNDIKISVRDIIGRELAHYKSTLNQGNYTFDFYSGSDKYYLLTVIGEKTSKTIKMLNSNSKITNEKKCKLVYNKHEDKINGFKSRKSINNFVFKQGDQLQYTGYAKITEGILGNDVIDDIPQTNMDYLFSITNGLRCSGVPIVYDIDGNIYSTLQIGSQCWLKENLKTTTYQNGIPIPNVTDNNNWSNLTTGAYAWYENDIGWKNIYGAIYNWHAINDTNGLCPEGWHVPSHIEWRTFSESIGGTLDPHGNELKSCRQINSPLDGDCNTTEHPRWNEINTNFGTDDYWFSGLPSGRREANGLFYGMGNLCYWWSSSDYAPTYAWGRALLYDSGDLHTLFAGKICGVSVRCIKD